MIHHDFSRAEYDARRDAINWSCLRHMAMSPRHYQQARLRQTVETDAMRVGRALHCAVLEPEKLATEFVTWPSRRAGKEWDAFDAQNASKTILTEAQSATVANMALALTGNPDAVHLMRRDGHREATVLWKHGEQPCRSRLDWYHLDEGIVDLKSARDVTPAAFGRQMATGGVLGQMAFYRQAMRWATDRTLPVHLVAVEKTAPFATAVYRVTEEQLAAGWRLCEELLARVERCTDAGFWPGPVIGIQDLQISDWAMDALEVDDG